MLSKVITVLTTRLLEEDRKRSFIDFVVEVQHDLRGGLNRSRENRVKVFVRGVGRYPLLTRNRRLFGFDGTLDG